MRTLPELSTCKALAAAEFGFGFWAWLKSDLDSDRGRVAHRGAVVGSDAWAGSGLGSDGGDERRRVWDSV